MRDRARQTVIPSGPLRAPPRGANRRAPPRTTACARQASGEVPKRQTGPPRKIPTSTPERPPAIPAEGRSPAAAPLGAATAPPTPRISGRPRAATVVSERSRSREPKQVAAARVTKRRGAIRHRLPRPSQPLQPRPRRRSAPSEGVNRQGDPRPASPHPEEGFCGADSTGARRESRRARPRLQPAGSQRLRGSQNRAEPRQALNAQPNTRGPVSPGPAVH